MNSNFVHISKFLCAGRSQPADLHRFLSKKCLFRNVWGIAEQKKNKNWCSCHAAQYKYFTAATIQWLKISMVLNLRCFTTNTSQRLQRAIQWTRYVMFSMRETARHVHCMTLYSYVPSSSEFSERAATVSQSDTVFDLQSSSFTVRSLQHHCRRKFLQKIEFIILYEKSWR